jgi:hypothetical protein
MAEAEHVICRAGGVGVMLGDAQVGLVHVVVQPIEDIGASLIVAASTFVLKGPYWPDTWV